MKIKLKKEITKAKKRFGDAFNETEFVTTNARVIGYREKKAEMLSTMARLLEAEDLLGVKALIEELGIVCPVSGSKNWTDVKQFNLMFGHQARCLVQKRQQICI